MFGTLRRTFEAKHDRSAGAPALRFLKTATTYIRPACEVFYLHIRRESAR